MKLVSLNGRVIAEVRSFTLCECGEMAPIHSSGSDSSLLWGRSKRAYGGSFEVITFTQDHTEEDFDDTEQLLPCSLYDCNGNIMLERVELMVSGYGVSSKDLEDSTGKRFTFIAWPPTVV